MSATCRARQAVVDFTLRARARARPTTRLRRRAWPAAVSEIVRRQVEAGSTSSRTARPPRSATPPTSRTATPASPATAPATPRPTSSCSRPSWSACRARGGTPNYARPMCTGEVRSKGQGELDKDIANLKAAMAAHGARTRLHERGLARRDLAVPAERLLPDARGLSRGARRRDARRNTAPSSRRGSTCSSTAPTSPCRGTCCSPTSPTTSSCSVAATHVEALNHALDGLPRGPRPRPHLLGQLRGPARLRHRHGQGLPDADEGAGALHPVRDREPPPRPRMDGVPRPRARDPRRQGPGARRRRHHDQLRRASGPRGAAAGAVHATSSARTG